MTRADELIIGKGAGGHLRHVPPDERAAVWNEIKDWLNAAVAPSYRPYEFASADGMTLLYVEESC